MPARILLLLASVALTACAQEEEAPPAVTTESAQPEAEDTLDANAEIAAAVPANDIWLLKLTGSGEAIVVGDARNATRRPGYDNQPAFLPDSSGFLYTVIEDGQQADVFRYDIETDARHRVTNTAESEYSPTPRPDGSFTSVRVEEDGTQRLWRFKQDEKPSVVLPDVRGVGYHAWLDENRLALFIVGEPHRLIVADSRDGGTFEVAENIGRGMAAMPAEDALSFIVLQGEEGSTENEVRGSIKRYDFADASTRDIIATRAGAQDYCWTRDGDLLMAEGRKLYRLPAGGKDWHLLADLTGQLPGDITRLALSPDGGRLALVAAEDAS